MVDFAKYDFSKEAASLKKKLLIKCRERYAKGLKQPCQVSDEELELVAAAGATEGCCPTPDIPCKSCPFYDEGAANHCSKGYTR